jgi:hypothetical protein
MRKRVNEANGGTNNSGKKTRYLKVFVKRTAKPQDDPQSTAPEIIQITIRNLDKDDANQIASTIIPNAKVFMADASAKGKTFKVPAISFTIPDAKFAKWLRNVLPKIQTVFENSNNGIYPQAPNLEQMILDEVHSTPSEVTSQRAEKSLKDLKQAIYKAISENRWDDAMVLYKKTINLVARAYGRQLSPNNVKSIYAQAEAAGIRPSDRGAETNSYWPDGTEKFWPTFVRSAQAWRKDFGRTIKDEPKMQYAMNSVNRVSADATTIDNRLKSQGFKSFNDLSLQQKDRIKNDGVSGGFKGVGYDISDTEGPDDFFLSPGLLNNLEGTLTDAAIADSEAWAKKMQDLKNANDQAQMTDQDKHKEKLATEEGQAEIFIDAIKKLLEMPKSEGGWQDLSVTVHDTGDPIMSYLLTIQDIAKAKLEHSRWNNKVNVEKIAQMITASVSLSTVGTSKIRSLGYNFQTVNNVFSSFEQFEPTVLGVSDSILSSLHKVTCKDGDDSLNESYVRRFFTLLERIDNRYNDGYKYELTEGLIHRPSNEKILDFLGEFGFSLSNEPMDDENEVM